MASTKQTAVKAYFPTDKTPFTKQKSLAERLFKNAENGDISILCTEGEIVREDRIILALIPFFQSAFNFKDSQSEISRSVNTIDLSHFSFQTVSKMVEFIYTDTQGISLKNLKLDLELYHLADYTLFTDLLQRVEQEIKNIYFTV